MSYRDVIDATPPPISDQPVCAMDDAFPIRNDDILVGLVADVLDQLKAITFILRRLEMIEADTEH